MTSVFITYIAMLFIAIHIHFWISSLQRITNAKCEIFANLDLALIGQPLPNTTLFIQRDDVGQSKITFRVDIFYWSDLPDSWKSQLLAEVLQ